MQHAILQRVAGWGPMAHSLLYSRVGKQTAATAPWQDVMCYYTIETVSWCVRLRCNVLFRLTYRREWKEELKMWADYLVCSEELAGTA